MFKEVLIVDDESLALDRLERLLKKLGVEKIYRAENSYKALEILKFHSEIKVVFLDIKMPGKNGLDLAKTISSLRDDIVLILQTAYPDYALEGYKIGAIDYLVKPYTLEEVQASLERAKRYLKVDEKRYLQVENTKGEKKLLPLEEIFYIKADLKHSLIKTKETFYFCSLSIGELENKLKKYGFIRIHRSYLVNLSKVEKVENGPYGKLVLKFKNSVEKLITSKSGASLFREKVKRLNLEED